MLQLLLGNVAVRARRQRIARALQHSGATTWPAFLTVCRYLKVPTPADASFDAWINALRDSLEAAPWIRSTTMQHTEIRGQPAEGALRRRGHETKQLGV